MTEPSYRVQLESVQWIEVLPGLRLFRSFRQSLSPGRLFLALLLVVLLFLGGKAMDVVWGEQVTAHAVERYTFLDAEGYEKYLAFYQEKDVEREPVFQTLVDRELYHFNRMITAIASLNFGLSEVVSGQGRVSGGVIGEIYRMVVTLPGWLYHTHPWFLRVYLVYGYLLTTLIGGAIARLAAVDACRGLHVSPFEAVRFSLAHGRWLISALLLPLVLAGLVGLLLALVGLLFNMAVTDVIAAMLFGVLLLGGFVIALLLIGTIVGCHLFIPAIAVEGSDAFDANSRSFSYILAHPWRYLIYLVTTIVYGAAGYLFVGILLFTTIAATKEMAGLFVFTHVQELGRFDAILPDPQLGKMMQEPVTDSLSAWGAAAAAIIGVWIKLLLAILPAFCVSFYFTAMTWTYLLLRYHTDGAAFDDLVLEEDQASQATYIPDKVEPAENHAG